MNSPLTRRHRHNNALSAVKAKSTRANNIKKGNNVFLARYKASLARHPPPPPKPSKWKNVKKALMIEGMKRYTAEPNNILKQPYLAKLLRQRMKNLPITTTVPLYRGVGLGHNKSVWPNKGSYVTNRFRSFSKSIKVANMFAGPRGTIYVIAPGTYPAINIANYVERRYPYTKRKFLNHTYNLEKVLNKEHPNFSKNLKNFIVTASKENEVLFHPGTWEIGNRRNNITGPHGQVVKNIKLVRA